MVSHTQSLQRIQVSIGNIICMIGPIHCVRLLIVKLSKLHSNQATLYNNLNSVWPDTINLAHAQIFHVLVSLLYVFRVLFLGSATDNNQVIHVHNAVHPFYLCIFSAN